MTRVSGKPIEIRVSQPKPAGSEDEPTFPPYDGPALFSYGFRPFFLGAALFAGVAVPAWILIVTGAIGSNFLVCPARVARPRDAVRLPARRDGRLYPDRDSQLDRSSSCERHPLGVVVRLVAGRTAGYRSHRGLFR